MGHLPGKQHLLYFKSRILNLLPLILLELILTFADEYQVQMFSGPFLEGSSDVEQCCDRNDIVCISYPGDFYEHQIPKRSLTAKKNCWIKYIMVAEVKNELQVKMFQSFLKNCMFPSVPWYNIVKKIKLPVVLNHFGLKSKCTRVRKLVPVVKSYVINITKHMMKVYK